MKLRPGFALLLAVLTLPLFARAAGSNADRAERAKAMTTARLAYAGSSEYDPYNGDVSKNVDHAAQLLDQGKFNAAIEEADRGLKLDHFNIDLLVIKAAAQRESGDVREADLTRQQWMAVVDSILTTGDGKTFDSAYRVITVSEEYGVMRILHLHQAKQSLVAHERSQYDVFTIRDDKAGADTQVFFNIDLPKGWLDRRFSAAKQR